MLTAYTHFVQEAQMVCSFGERCIQLLAQQGQPHVFASKCIVYVLVSASLV